jgi:hypothetical protein
MNDAINGWCFHVTRWFRPTLQEGYTRLKRHNNHEYHFWGGWKCPESELHNLMARLERNGFVVEATTTPIRKNGFVVEATTLTYDRVAIGLWLALVLTVAMGVTHIYILTQ